MSANESYCGHCGKSASRRCGQCKDICYCTLECQQADWYDRDAKFKLTRTLLTGVCRQFHKLLCKQVDSFREKTNEAVRRAIFLPEHEDKPILLWLPVECAGEEGDEYVDEAPKDVSHELGVPSDERNKKSVMPAPNNVILESGSPKAMYLSLVHDNKGCGELLDHSIVMMIRQDQPDCAPNQCLSRLAPGAGFNIRGPVVFLRHTRAADPPSTLDIRTSDFTLAINGIIELGKPTSSGKNLDVADHRKKVLGVKISQDPLRFEHVEVPRRHPVFKTGKLYGITDVLKSPIRMFKYPVGTAPAIDDDPGHKHHTMSLNALCLNIDRHSPDFAKIPAAFTDHLSPVLLVCADGRELSHCKLGNLCDLINNKIQPTLLKVPQELRGEIVEELKSQWGAIFGLFNAAGLKPGGLSPWG